MVNLLRLYSAKFKIFRVTVLQENTRCPRKTSLNTGSLLFNIRVEHSVFVIAFGL